MNKKRRFGAEVRFIGTDGKADIHYTNFSPDIMDWQFLSDVYVAKKRLYQVLRLPTHTVIMQI